jgi:hypothetical protein
MKKILLILLVIVIPYQTIQAFPNEPSGALGLTYESSVNDLIKLFPNAKRDDIHFSGYEQYRVDLDQRLYNLQASWAMFSFMDGKLFSINIDFKPEEVYDITGLDDFYSPKNLEAIVDMMDLVDKTNTINKERRELSKLNILLEKRLTDIYGEPEMFENSDNIFIIWRGRISGVTLLELGSIQIMNARKVIKFHKRFGEMAKKIKEEL